MDSDADDLIAGIRSAEKFRRDCGFALSVTAAYAETIDRISVLAVPKLALLCFLDIVEDGTLVRRSLVADPLLGAFKNSKCEAPHPDSGEGVASVLRSLKPTMYGKSWFQALIGADRALAGFVDELQSVVILPLIFDKRATGIMTLGYAVAPGDVDFALAEDFSIMAAVAISNARLMEEVRRNRELADSARARLGYVSRTSAILARSFDRTATMQRFVATTALDFADGAHAVVVNDDSRAEHYRAGSADNPLMEERALRAMRDARTRLDPGGRGLSAPMLSGGRVGGALSFSRSPDREPFEIDDLIMVEELAARAAMYLESSRAFEHERNVAQTLQRAFRPRDLPKIPGITIASAYLPGTADVDVGGDWYDVVVLDEHRVAFAIGDVMGHGVEAAATMSEIRNGLRAHLFAQAPPGRSLGLVDTLLTYGVERDMFATSLIAIYNREDHSFVMSSAGHPMPFARSASGVVTELGRPTTLLGLDAGERTETRHVFEPGQVIVFFTDGVVEDRGREYDEGAAALVSIVEHSPDLSEIVARALGLVPSASDDRTILAFRIDN